MGIAGVIGRTIFGTYNQPRHMCSPQPNKDFFEFVTSQSTDQVVNRVRGEYINVGSCTDMTYFGFLRTPPKPVEENVRRVYPFAAALDLT